MSKVKLGLVGCGKHMTDTLIPCIGSLQSANIIGYLGKESREGRNKVYDDYKLYSDIASIVSDSKIEKVVAAATPKVHELVIQLCQTYEKPCFIEKPPFYDYSSISNFSPKNSKLIYTGLNFRFSKVLSTAKEVSNQFGEIQDVSIEFCSKNPKSPKNYVTLEEEIHYEMGIHAIDTAMVFVEGAEFNSVSFFEFDNRKRFRVNLSNNKGQTALLEYGNYSNSFKFIIRIVTKQNVVIMIENLNRISINGVPSDFVYEKLGQKFDLNYEWPIRRNSFEKVGYSIGMKNFLEDEEPSPSFETLVNIYKIIDQINA